MRSRRARRSSGISGGRLAAIPLEPRQYTPLEVFIPKDKFRSRLITTFAEHAVAELVAMATIPLAEEA